MKGKKRSLAKWQKEWLQLKDEVDWNLFCFRDLLGISSTMPR